VCYNAGHYQEVETMSDTALIQTIDLTKHYGQHKAVEGLNFAVHGGEIFGFLGPNGAGKSTTMKMIVGLLRPTRGQAIVAGCDVEKEPVAAKSVIGYVPEEPHLYPKLAGREFLRFVGDLYNMPADQVKRRADELLRLFDLDEAADGLIDSYSHGMRQKTAIAAALMHDPRVLVLDEPTSGLDPKSARLIKDILRQMAERGTAVFLSTHIMEIAERMCDRIGIINAGQLAAVGTMDELRAGAAGQASLEDIFLTLTGGAEYAEIAEVLR
jgi:ABC-2 type transport system ATP-binding protein